MSRSHTSADMSPSYPPSTNMNDRPNLSEAEQRALEHCWNWFTLHANQRLQCVYYFLVAMSLLSAAYASALASSHTGIATAIAVLGFMFTFGFSMLEQRTKELVKAAENPLGLLQARLVEATGIEQLKLVERVEFPSSAALSYSKTINALHLVALGGFLGAAVYTWVCK